MRRFILQKVSSFFKKGDHFSFIFNLKETKINVGEELKKAARICLFQIIIKGNCTEKTGSGSLFSEGLRYYASESEYQKKRKL